MSADYPIRVQLKFQLIADHDGAANVWYLTMGLVNAFA